MLFWLYNIVYHTEVFQKCRMKSSSFQKDTILVRLVDYAAVSLLKNVVFGGLLECCEGSFGLLTESHVIYVFDEDGKLLNEFLVYDSVDILFVKCFAEFIMDSNLAGRAYLSFFSYLAFDFVEGLQVDV